LCDRGVALCDRLPLARLERFALCERLPLLRAWLPPADFAEPPLDLLAASADGTIALRASISVPDSTHFRNEFLMHCSASRPAILAIYISPLIALRSTAALHP
jgi:hypothetical protein